MNWSFVPHLGLELVWWMLSIRARGWRRKKTKTFLAMRRDCADCPAFAFIYSKLAPSLFSEGRRLSFHPERKRICVLPSMSCRGSLPEHLFCLGGAINWLACQMLRLWSNKSSMEKEEKVEVPAQEDTYGGDQQWVCYYYFCDATYISSCCCCGW